MWHCPVLVSIGTPVLRAAKPCLWLFMLIGLLAAPTAASAAPDLSGRQLDLEWGDPENKVNTHVRPGVFRTSRIVIEAGVPGKPVRASLLDPSKSAFVPVRPVPGRCVNCETHDSGWTTGMIAFAIAALLILLGRHLKQVKDARQAVASGARQAMVATSSVRPDRPSFEGIERTGASRATPSSKPDDGAVARAAREAEAQRQAAAAAAVADAARQKAERDAVAKSRRDAAAKAKRQAELEAERNRLHEGLVAIGRRLVSNVEDVERRSFYQKRQYVRKFNDLVRLPFHPKPSTNLLLKFLGYEQDPGAFVDKAALWIPKGHEASARQAIGRMIYKNGAYDFTPFEDYVNHLRATRPDLDTSAKIARELVGKIQGRTPWEFDG